MYTNDSCVGSARLRCHRPESRHSDPKSGFPHKTLDHPDRHDPQVKEPYLFCGVRLSPKHLAFRYCRYGTIRKGVKNDEYIFSLVRGDGSNSFTAQVGNLPSAVEDSVQWWQREVLGSEPHLDVWMPKRASWAQPISRTSMASNLSHVMIVAIPETVRSLRIAHLCAVHAEHALLRGPLTQGVIEEHTRTQ